MIIKLQKRMLLRGGNLPHQATDPLPSPIFVLKLLISRTIFMSQVTVKNLVGKLFLIALLTIAVSSVYAQASSQNNLALSGRFEIPGNYQVSASYLLNLTNQSLLDEVILQLAAEPGSAAVTVVRLSLDEKTGWVTCTPQDNSRWVCDFGGLNMLVSEIETLNVVVN
jgi:hypothetical protein